MPVTLLALLFAVTSAPPAAAQSPTDSAATVAVQWLATPPDTITSGDLVEVVVTANNIPSPGIFGFQFTLTYPPQQLRAIDNRFQAGDGWQPAVTALQQIDPVAGRATLAVSRQGDVDNISGHIVLATLAFEISGASTATETMVIALSEITLGAKGGEELLVAHVEDLPIVLQADDVSLGPAEMNGVIALEGKPQEHMTEVSLQAVNSRGETVTVFTTGDGAFLLPILTPDTYTLTASHPGYLSATCLGVHHLAPSITTLNRVTLLAGDLDQNRSIDISDVVAFGIVFGRANPNQPADFNRDAEVNILDLILLAANYGQTSASTPWNCQLEAELSN